MYYLLLIISAIIAYAFGSLSTLTIASLYVYKKNLRKLGKGNTWFSNFRRIYGLGGLLTLLLVELVKDIVPIIIGGLLLSIKGHGDIALLAAVLLIWITKYISLGSIGAAAMMLVTAILVADQRLVIYLSLAVLLVVLMRGLPSIVRIAGGKEMRLSFEKDLSYKFDK